MPSSRPSLYSSPIQHVLVLQEEEGIEDEDPVNFRLRNSAIPIRAEFSQATSSVSGQTPGVYPWRIANRMRTANGALVLCLNIGVDPPDVFKPNPCAKLECWTDPNLENSTKSLQQIGSALRGQYEQWQVKAKYRLCADPTASELKRACMSLRRAAKDERVLFHYNGHGVPKPTPNGEIWVFNHNYTQYIPMDLMDLQDALGSPSLMVFDCNAAGIIHRHFKRIVEHQEHNWQQQSAGNSDKIVPSHRNSIFLGACGESELLPTNPILPADLFTACLTTPIKTLLKWFTQRTLIQGITPEMIDRVPGNLNLRQTPLGEINWIFTAVTDAIAWNVLPREKFKMLYRQDLLVASLMRNFLLADRIMRSYGCTPVSLPALPATHNHHLWHACDLAVEQLLSQLPKLIAVEDEKLRMACMQKEGSTTAQSATVTKAGVTTTHHTTPCSPGESSGAQHCDVGSEVYSSTATSRKPPTGRSIETQSSATDHMYTKNGGLDGVYVSTTFFEDQMKAFDVWLDMGPDQRDPPEQLPIVLQALLSPHYRVKVLPLFSKYMQTGPVAVDLVLSVGMFPYVQKLLESQSIELRPDLVFIWSKILALDNTCRTDLVKEKGEIFFVRFLEQQHLLGTRANPVYVAVALFVLSVVANGYADRCVEVGTLEACLRHINHEDQFVRRWACLCLTAVIQNGSRRTQSSVIGWDELLRLVRKSATEDAAPDVRAAATSALAIIMGSTLRFLSPGNIRGQSSQESRNEYQPSSPAAQNRTVGADTRGGESFSPGANVIGVRGNHVESLLNIDGCEETRSNTGLGQSELPDEPGPEFSSEERDVLLKIGFEVAEIGRKESSVLVRREVAIAIAQAVRYQHGRFVRAAIGADIHGIDDTLVDNSSADIDNCELVYRRLWTTLSELAFDPHPIVAALARRSYDTVSETLLRKRAIAGTSRRISSQSLSRKYDHVFALREQRGVSVKGVAIGMRAEDSLTNSANSSQLNRDEKESIAAGSNCQPESPRSKTYEAQSEDCGSTFSQNGSFASRYSELRSKEAQAIENTAIGLAGATSEHATNASRAHVPGDRSAEVHVPTASIHVRSTSGSFDLNVPSRLPYLSTMPRVNSASLVPPVTGSLSGRGVPLSLTNKDITASPSLERIAEEREDAAGSLPKIALAKGVGMLMKTVTQQLHIPGLASASTTLPRSYGSNSSTEAREEKDGVDVKSLSPPRPPRRSLSYQVLNAVSSLSPSSEIPIFASSRPTYFASAGAEAADEGLGRFLKKLPRGYERLYLSGHGDAALSLYEWSSAYISRVEFDAAAPSRVSEEENVPRYAALWDKFIKTSGRIPSESLRAFALLGAGANGMGVRNGATMGDEGNNYTFSEISSYAMGAGGGAVLAMAFLPRDIGMGDDQLIATGDSTGSVGVYDIRSGNCQGSFGIPFPPGIPEVGVSSILCLNRPSPTASEVSLSVGHSQSALIMAGAYDGRVAVFKSDLQGPKYRIMSTFQASGQSYWSKVGTSREPGHKPSQHDVMNGTQNSPHSSCSFETSSPLSFSDTVRESGNGLVLAFDSDSSYLAAAGCDMENVRVWDLSREQCIWEGAVVSAGTWPTAVTMWGRINPALFVVGASDGRINVVDIRERSRPDALGQPLVPMGRLSEPIISLGTCPPVGRFSGEVVVSADIGGEIVFWDARWNIDTGIEQGLMASEPELSRIKAHRSNLTAMAVHPLGTLIASGSTARCVKVFGPNRNMLKMLCSHETGNELESASRIPPVTSLGFQPESNLLAIGAVDSSVMIYGKPDTFPGVRAHVDQVTEAERSALYEYWR
eukprot:GFKZ01003328.1.p1 GENE.GFKZ01003328.1~~GFKZ01003328.1.p1  ORF type:complete len:1806 (-),score=168.39 GFKZ01003328.1:2028-7445(-)